MLCRRIHIKSTVALFSRDLLLLGFKNVIVSGLLISFGKLFDAQKSICKESAPSTFILCEAFTQMTTNTVLKKILSHLSNDPK